MPFFLKTIKRGVALIPNDTDLKHSCTSSAEKCKQLGENEVMLEKIATNYELMQKDKQHVDGEYSTLKLKNQDLKESLNRALEQRDLARSEVSTLYAQLDAVNNEKYNTEAILRGMLLGIVIQYQYLTIFRCSC